MGRFRTVIAALCAIAVTFGLFIFMYKLVSSGDGTRDNLDPISGIRFGPVDIPDEVTTRSRRRPPPPPPPEEPPPPPKMEVSKPQAVVQNMPDIDIPSIDNPLVGGEGMFLGNFGTVDQTAEGDAVPMVVIQPMYPREAAIEGIEGWVRLEFTIMPDGSVKSPKVIEAEPRRIFNREALRAILKWKFKPRVVEGQAVERIATYTIDFKLGG